ncbi:MAG: hypothetical protein GWN58_47435 [Anaerolineae bacterium]|nr:hypothetical protein [Anaerolineae bacterium]
MTQLIVTPIDMSAPGSFRQRSRLMRAIAMMRDNKDGAAVAAAYIAVEDLVLERLETDDGTPVEDVLDRLSADDFDELLQTMAGENAVPTESAGS